MWGVAVAMPYIFVVNKERKCYNLFNVRGNCTSSIIWCEM